MAIEDIWCERWQGKHSWIKTVLPELEGWLRRAKGVNTDFFITQVLTGHGAFNDYLLRFHLRDNDDCVYCRESDGVEHTILSCSQWYSERRAWMQSTREGRKMAAGDAVSLRSVLKEAIEYNPSFEIFSGMARSILKKKMGDERRRIG